MRPIINFDERFEAYASLWMRENTALYKNNMDAMEAKMPEVYAAWLERPADWLEGLAPGVYFDAFTDADALVEWMLDYFREKVPVPDQLLERITALGEPSERALHSVLSNGFQIEEARLTAISLLSEMESAMPMPLYIEWIARRKESDDLSDLAAEALISMGQAIVRPVLSAFPGATPAGQETFADVLCNFPGDDAIFDLTLSLFLSRRDKLAMYASLLGKLGDTRALPALQRAASEDSIAYLDFVEIRGAIESLGEEVPEEPEFSGDPAYESLRRME